MPHNAKPKDGWTVVKRGIPEQTLAPSEAESFLNWLFSDLSRKPQEMTLRETASVARYLIWLSSHGVPKAVAKGGPTAIRGYRRGLKTEESIRGRQDAERSALIVWGDLLRTGRFAPANKKAALAFFRRHSSAWDHPWLLSGLKFLEDFEVPKD